MQEEDPIIGGYLIDLDISDVSNEIPSIRPPRFPVRPHPPFFHPIPPSLDLPRPWFARNIIDLILNPCIIKGAFASIVTFPPIFDETVPDYPIVGPIYPPTVQSPQAPSPSRPSRPTAPRGWIPIYGNWCGLGHPPAGNRPPLPGGGIDLMDSMAPLPIDALDSCCFNHDDCFEQHNCSGIRLAFPICIMCNCALVNCAARVDCSRSPSPASCLRAKGIIIGGAGLFAPPWCLFHF